MGDPINDREMLLAMIAAGEVRPSALISHQMSLDEAPRAYELFDRREATKVVLAP
jgi:threonine dehydrogenase-like Zn-dependent dehydrogenase